MRWLVGLLGVAVLVTGAVPAFAGGLANWCIDPAQSAAGVAACEQDTTPCMNSTTYATVAEAVAAARLDTSVSEHRFCVASPAPHTEAIVIDNSDGALGAVVQLRFVNGGGGQGLCVPASAGAAISLIGQSGGGSEFDVSNLWSDFSTCPADQRVADLLHVTDALVELKYARVAHLVGGALRSWGWVFAVFDSGRISNFEGALLAGPAEVAMNNMELSGNRSSVGSPLLDFSQGEAGIVNSALFGNISEGAPLISMGADARFENTLIAANAVLDGSPLIDCMLGIQQAHCSIFGGEITRNRLLGPGTAEMPPLAPFGNGIIGDEWCLPVGSDGQNYIDRPDLVTTGDVSDLPLIRVDFQQGAVGNRVTLARTFVVDNQAGGVVGITGGGESAQVALLHNTFDVSGVPLVSGGAGSDLRIVASRNLYTTVPTYDLDDSLGVLELTMEAMPAPATDWAADLPAIGIVGPPVLYEGATFESASTVDSWDHCARVLAACPNVTDCNGIGPGGGAQECGLDTARAWFPDAALAEQIRVDWPWEGGYFPAGTGAAATAGATGWTCSAPQSFPYDVVDDDGTEGDADGYSTLTDCDETNPNETPSLPENNGIDTADCDEVDDCWTCPDGTVGDDDDSTGDDDDSSTGDDDDSGTGDDDDASSGPCPSDQPHCIEPGCHGCGYAFAPTTGVALLLIGAPMLRRRRTPRR